ncbi:hypothetical protein F0562_015542 [Nyssa sinensis]|uniref:Uncharacterized protein n=1 Tax=Nyssa sinensis TaxID=561372 RepID=A0A5J4ZKH2_9ASTE|nr:hypothetical protein F0562_015542 [Nyssa sinensis]
MADVTISIMEQQEEMKSAVKETSEVGGGTKEAISEANEGELTLDQPANRSIEVVGILEKPFLFLHRKMRP